MLGARLDVFVHKDAEEKYRSKADRKDTVEATTVMRCRYDMTRGIAERISVANIDEVQLETLEFDFDCTIQNLI